MIQNRPSIVVDSLVGKQDRRLKMVLAYHFLVGMLTDVVCS